MSQYVNGICCVYNKHLLEKKSKLRILNPAGQRGLLWILWFLSDRAFWKVFLKGGQNLEGDRQDDLYDHQSIFNWIFAKPSESKHFPTAAPKSIHLTVTSFYPIYPSFICSWWKFQTWLPCLMLTCQLATRLQALAKRKGCLIPADIDIEVRICSDAKKSFFFYGASEALKIYGLYWKTTTTKKKTLLRAFSLLWL